MYMFHLQFQFTGYMALSTILFYGSTLISKGLLTYGRNYFRVRSYGTVVVEIR